MKKHITKKRTLTLQPETIRVLAQRDMRAAIGGASGTYCAGCGTGTACPQLEI